MAAIVVEGTARWPVRYGSWAEWRGKPPAGALPLVTPNTGSCGLCWGAGRIHEQAANGEGLVPLPCEACGGSGLVPTLPR